MTLLQAIFGITIIYVLGIAPILLAYKLGWKLGDIILEKMGWN